MTGGDAQWIAHFMQSPNTLTGGTPQQQIESIQGLVTVLQCVDALRGKV
ncbi:MAG TPA: MbcA/ParS/Xre antitoxin family protein [Castellaniella sp.]|nr:MbcA/ParS/Xre antitoxin family protein [Castellaniella sp.]